MTAAARGPAAAMPAAPLAQPRREASRRWLWLALAAVAVYPVSVLAYVYWYALTSGLPGPRHGPQDAYRHTLASAVVAYTLSPRAVQWVTTVMEFADDAASRMDRHNNAIGAAIGAQSASFAQVRPEVEARVAAGRAGATDAQQVTWLPRWQWRELPF